MNIFLIFGWWTDPWQDLKDDYGKGGYERITNLRQQFPHLKVINSIVDISQQINEMK